MAIEAVKIPTNIQVEERIIGPLSLRQIAILLLTAGLSYGIWGIATKDNPNLNILLQGLCWTPFIIGLCFSFVQVNGVSLFTIVLLSLEKLDKPTVRKFGPREGLTINIKTSTKPEPEVQPKKRPSADFSKLGSVLDAGLTREAEANKPIEHSAVLDAIRAPDTSETESVHITPEDTTPAKEPPATDTTDDTPPAGLIRDIHPNV